jgi:hypothetical protein
MITVHGGMTVVWTEIYTMVFKKMVTEERQKGEIG